MPLDDTIDHWLALRHDPRIKPGVLIRLMGLVDDPRELASLPAARLNEAGVDKSGLEGLKEPRPGAHYEQDKAWLDGAEHRHVLALSDRAYPEELCRIPDPPPLLYVTGDVTLLTRAPGLAVVGSRSATRVGEETARIFGRDLAAAGLTIVSGLARGIDGAAHRGALEGKGATIAVLGNGPDRIYPRENTALAEALLEQGAVVSELPVGTPPRGGNFPRRNRIISGLAFGVLVVEASERSGALGTARRAAEQGREVFAVPGSIHSPQSRGPHRLIREGAKLVEDMADISEELPSSTRVPTRSPEGDVSNGTPLDSETRQVLNALDFTPLSQDQVAEQSGLTPERVSAILLDLEIEGLIAAEAGGFYTRLPDGNEGP